MGREVSEPPDETRFPFQRDRDRIIHTQAFRRLKGKTQVFVAGEGDHYRTRLTHTMEVAQISRDAARTLGLNEDLAEAIALAHDLGHPPFGHAGEEALDTWMRAQGLPGFEHNRQSLRIVTLLEQHCTQYRGLNVNREVLEGLQKHRTPYDRASEDPGVPQRWPSLEAAIVNLADEIAYTAHDCDDGLRAGLFPFEDLRTVAIAREAVARAQPRGTELRGALIHLLLADLYASSQKRLQDEQIRSLEDVYHHPRPLIAFSGTMRDVIEELHRFLWERLYLHPDILSANMEGKATVKTLCHHLHSDPSDKVKEMHRNFDGALAEAVKDYVAGMTDWFALEQVRRAD